MTKKKTSKKTTPNRAARDAVIATLDEVSDPGLMSPHDYRSLLEELLTDLEARLECVVNETADREDR